MPAVWKITADDEWRVVAETRKIPEAVRPKAAVRAPRTDIRALGSGQFCVLGAAQRSSSVGVVAKRECGLNRQWLSRVSATKAHYRAIGRHPAARR